MVCCALFMASGILCAQSVRPIIPEVSLYASGDYSVIRDMSNVLVSLYDARQDDEEDVAAEMRRYDDSIDKVHPSVMMNQHAPTHIVVAANTRQEVESAVESVNQLRQKSRSRGRRTKLIVLYGNDSQQLAESDLSGVSAVFSAGSAERPFDILTQAFFGGVEVGKQTEWLSLDKGRLMSVNQEKIRLGYGVPEMVGMNSEALKDIDNIAAKMIKDEASPGCYVLIARHGVVVWSKGYGSTMYRNGKEVDGDMLYDVASVSKAIGTLPVVMHAMDEGKIDEKTTLGSILPEVDDNKAGIKMSELLLHQSGLPAGIAHYLICVDSTSFTPPLYSRKRKAGYQLQIESYLYLNSRAKLKDGLFSSERSPEYSVEVTRDRFITDSMRMAVLDKIDKSAVGKKSYRYSDMNFIYLQQVLERIYGRTLSDQWTKYVARPLGLKRLLYRPLTKYDLDEIVPTEDDKHFRQELVHGTVHDPTAALLGGIAGNAGLFGTANEIAKIAQMYLQKGYYGGLQLIKSETVEMFTKRHSTTCRRGYGFDKPERSGGGPVCDLASQSSYGHSGFSGTLFWVDPDKDMVYIFLSNRICPKAYNSKLTTTNVRSAIHEAAYKSILE